MRPKNMLRIALADEVGAGALRDAGGIERAGIDVTAIDPVELVRSCRR